MYIKKRLVNGRFFSLWELQILFPINRNHLTTEQEGAPKGTRTPDLLGALTIVSILHMLNYLDLPFVTFETAELAYGQFFNPLLTCEDPGIWDPAIWGWKTVS